MFTTVFCSFDFNRNCCSGKRQAISIAPMAPLQKVIDAFCFQQKPQLDVSGCQLSFQKQVLDPTIPVRFANLPKEAKLELIADTGTIMSGAVHLSMHTLTPPSTQYV